MNNKIFKLNEFSENFKKTVSKNIFLIKYFGRQPTGADWENIVSEGMKAKRIGGNEKLADVKNDVTAWSCKTIGNKNILKIKNTNIISGRFDLEGKYNIDKAIRKLDPCEAGKRLIETWNERVFDIANRYNDLRTIVLLRDCMLNYVSFYEEIAEPYSYDDYTWLWNDNGVLEGCDKTNGLKKFAYQSSGTQLRIYSDIPDEMVILKIGKPNRKDIDSLLEIAGYQDGESAIEIKKEEQLQFDFVRN